MSKTKMPEVWLRGPLASVPPLLQPAAHTLLQVQEEVHGLLEDFPEDLLWTQIAETASPGFHIKHICGVIDRLFTYARGESLSEEQLTDMKAEGQDMGETIPMLTERLDTQIAKAMDELSKLDERILKEIRYVGRARIPSTVLGLIFHAAEHSMRHTGQLLVTLRVLQFNRQKNH